MWNKKNASYIHLKEYLPCINIKYESLLVAPEKIINQIGIQLKIKKGEEKVKIIDGPLMKGSEKDFAYYQNYYLKNLWRHELNKCSIETINEYLDEHIMAHFKYEKI